MKTPSLEILGEGVFQDRGIAIQASIACDRTNSTATKEEDLP